MTIVLLVGSTFLLLGLFVLLWNEKRRKLANSASEWPVVIGRIGESRVHYAVPGRDESDCLIFSYRYDVHGVAHVGKSLDLFELEKRATLVEMEKIVQSYPAGAPISVHYDVDDPSRSVIEPGLRVAYYRNRNLGAFLILAGILTMSFLKLA